MYQEIEQLISELCADHAHNCAHSEDATPIEINKPFHNMYSTVHQQERLNLPHVPFYFNPDIHSKQPFWHGNPFRHSASQFKKMSFNSS